MMIDNLLLYQQNLQYRLTLLKPTYVEVDILNEAFEIKYTGSLLNINELSFLLPYYIDEKINDNFSKVQCGYLIYCELINEQSNMVYLKEYFLINNIKNVGNDKETKSVECIGMEFLLGQKLLKNYKGKKKLFRTAEELAAYVPSSEYPTFDSFRESGILNTVFRLASSWKIGSIDEEVNDIFREFDIDSVSVLDFLINTCAASYGVIFFFDSIEKTISIRSLNHLGTFKGFFLSDSSYIKSITETINQDDMATKIYLYGANGLSIREVNILGEEYLLDFSYYRNSNFMSQNLLDSLDNYDSLLSSMQNEFSILRADLSIYNNQLNTQNSELNLLKDELADLEKEKDDLVANEEDLTSINSQIAAKNIEISNKESEMTTTQSNIDSVITNIENLQLLLLIESNFTSEELAELDPLIKEKEVRFDTIVDAQELYDKGLEIIERIKEPSIQFDIDIIDVFSSVENQLDWSRVTLGDIAAIKYERFNVNVELRIISYFYDDENNRLSLTFGNKRDINNPNMIFDELKSAISTTTSLDINKYKFLDYINSGDKSKINEYINGLLNLSAQGAQAGSSQEVLIDARGITLKSPSEPQKQVRLMHDRIVFTDDGWQSSKIALSGSAGVVAEAVRGLLGEFCTMRADQIVVGDAGEVLSDDVLGNNLLKQNVEYNQVIINTDVGIKTSHPNDGSFTQMNGDGFNRNIPIPIYSESYSGIPNQENFNNKTTTILASEGWEFNHAYNDSATIYGARVENNELKIFTDTFQSIGYKSNEKCVGMARKYINTTKDNANFSFNYRVGSGTDSCTFLIDGVSYTLNSTANTTFSATLSKGLHCLQWISGANSILYLDNIVFEQNPVILTQIGNSNEVRNYNYITHIGEGSTVLGFSTDVEADDVYKGTENFISDVWVQLPEELKGKQFKAFVALQDTGQSGTLGIGKIKLGVEEIDYNNARIRVRCRLTRFNVYVENNPYVGAIYHIIYSFSGGDFLYFVTY